MAVVTFTDPPTYKTSNMNKDLTSQLRLGDLNASYSSAVLQKQLKLAVIVSLDCP